MSLIKNIKLFISYWYQRYLLATELYMVEPWEKVFIHVVFGILLALFWYINTVMLVKGVAQFRDPAYLAQVS